MGSNKKITNHTLKRKYDEIYKHGAYENFFTFDNDTLLHAILDKLDDLSGKSLLDVGCGEGDFLAMLERSNAKTLTGIDYSKEAIKIAEGRLNHRKDIILECIEAKEVTDKYDVITMAGILEHMDEPFGLLRKLIKTNLNDEGLLVTVSPSFMNPRGYIWMTLQMLLDVPMSLSDLHFFTPDDFIKFAKKNDAEIEIDTFDQDWGGGERTILDFKKRLVNALRDAKLDNTRVDTFLSWLETALPYFNHTKYSGALMIISLRVK